MNRSDQMRSIIDKFDDAISRFPTAEIEKMVRAEIRRGLKRMLANMTPEQRREFRKMRREERGP